MKESGDFGFDLRELLALHGSALATEAEAVVFHFEEAAGAVKDLVETCRHESRKPRDPRSLDDVIQTFVPMALIQQLDGQLHSAIRLHYQDKEALSLKLDVLKQAVAYHRARCAPLHSSRRERLKRDHRPVV